MDDRSPTEVLLVEQAAVLEAIGTGRPLDECLQAICLAVGRLESGTRACILLTDAGASHFARVLAPRFPPEFERRLTGAPIDDRAIGTCGTAVHEGRAVACEDIAAGSAWSDAWRELCLACGIRACLSTPIRGSNGSPSGSFMLCFGEPRAATRWELRLAEFGVHVAGLALERERSLAALRDSEERFRQIAGSVETVFYVLDWPAARVSYVSPAYARLWGLAEADLYADRLSWLRLIDPDDAQPVAQRFEGFIAGDNSFDVEYRVHLPDGRRRWVHDRATVGGRDADGRICRIVGVAEDVSERKNSEEQLRRGHDTFLSLIQNAPFGTYLVDAQFRLAQLSAGANKVFAGVDPLLGRDFADVLRIVWPEPFASEVIARFRHTLATGEPFHSPNTVEQRAGIDRTESYDWRLERVALPDGQFGVVCYFYDLTERRHAEQDARLLAELGERIRVADDPARLLAATATALGRYLRLDGCYMAEIDEARDRIEVFDDYRSDPGSVIGVYRISDYPAVLIDDSRAGRTLVINDASSDPRTAAIFDAAFAPFGTCAVIAVPLHRDGRWVANLVASTATSRIWQERETALLEVVTERVWNAIEKLRLDAALRESEAVFRTLGEALPDFLWMSDAQGQPIYQNPAWHAYTGMSHDDLVREGWQKMPHPQDLARLEAVWTQAVQTGSAFEVEYRCRRHDGEYRWFISRTVPIKDADGQVTRWVGTTVDIHDRRLAEQALRDADHRKDEFLAVLAHELRNPLAPIRNAAALLRRAVPGSGELGSITAMLQRQVDQMVRLVDELIDVGRISSGRIELKRERVDVADVVGQAVEAVRAQIEAKAQRLDLRLPRQPVAVDADRARLAQMIGNLLHNACKFSPRGGRIELTVEPLGAELRLCVGDQGIGIAPADLQRVFEMFTQLDASAEREHGGLGIGLSIVRRLAQLHGGDVTARSAGRGRGAEFELRLPLAADVTVPAPTPAAPSPTDCCRVLVVDDNRDAADSLALLLTGCGHQARAAYDGREAIAAAARWRPHMVLLDIGMPGLNGYDAARDLRAEFAGDGQQPLLVALTGWGQPQHRALSAAAGFDAHLVKPVDFDAVLELLARLQRTVQAATAPRVGSTTGYASSLPTIARANR